MRKFPSDCISVLSETAHGVTCRERAQGVVQRFEEGSHGAGEGVGKQRRGWSLGEWEGRTQLAGREFTLRQHSAFLLFSAATFAARVGGIRS